MDIKEILDKYTLQEIKGYLEKRLQDPQVMVKKSKPEKLIFWLDDDAVGQGVGGNFVKRDLFSSLQVIRQANRKLVGIVLHVTTQRIELVIDKALPKEGED